MEKTANILQGINPIDICPYDKLRESQEQMITNITESLKEKDCVVEVAPNGVGKTIALLLAGLSMKSNGIIIVSRTIRQLNHYVEEIEQIEKKSKIPIPFVICSARKNYCINQEVIDLDEDLIDFGCQKASDHFTNRYERGRDIDENYCTYRSLENRKIVKVLISDYTGNEPKLADIHRLKSYGNHFKKCPYYLARMLSSKYPISLQTYNYIFDPSIRRAYNIDLRGKIIIVDECHNVTSTMENSMKRTIDSATIKRLKDNPIVIQKVLFFLSKVDKFINHFAHEQQKNSYSFISYTEFESLMQLYRITRSSLDAFKLEIKDFSRKPSLFGTNLLLSEIASFFDIFFQIKSNAFRSYCNIERKNGFKNITIGVQSLYVAPIIKEIIEEGAKVIFATGTLSTEIFCFRLGLQGEDVKTDVHEYLMSKRRIQTYIMETGVNKSVLSTEFYKRVYDIQVDYGKTIQKIIPNIPGGSLIFFPSYPLKTEMLEAWNDEKVILKKDNDSYMIMENGTKIKVFDDEGDGGAIGEFKEFVINNKAILTAVYRSRASEGEDYPDDLCRGVFIIGIPLANATDGAVKLKIQFYNELKSGYGDRWYTSDAMDAVNQACGRGIRSDVDYCTIFLMDKRFSTGRYYSYLSGWIRGGLVTDPPKHEHIVEKINPLLKIFFKNNENLNKRILKEKNRLK